MKILFCYKTFMNIIFLPIPPTHLGPTLSQPHHGQLVLFVFECFLSYTIFLIICISPFSHNVLQHHPTSPC